MNCSAGGRKEGGEHGSELVIEQRSKTSLVVLSVIGRYAHCVTSRSKCSVGGREPYLRKNQMVLNPSDGFQASIRVVGSRTVRL